MRKAFLTSSLVLALAASTTVFAEAPVYDVDSMTTDGSTQSESINLQDAPEVKSVATDSPGSGSLNQRLEKLEQQAENMQQADVSNRLGAMQTEIQNLRGQVEELTHKLQAQNTRRGVQTEPTEPTMSSLPRVSDEEASPQAARTPKAKTPASLAQQVEAKPASSLAESAAKAKLIKAPVVAAASVEKPVVSAEQPETSEEQAVYQTAYNLIKAKKYSEAIGALQKMLVKYPSGQFAANAHYWLGELYSLTGDNEQAATEFMSVVKHYPNNSRISDAELKLGLIYATQLKWADAKNSFRRVITKNPGSTSARLAMEQLKQLKQSGH